VNDSGDPGPRGRGDRQAVAVIAEDDDGVRERVAARFEHLLELARDVGATASQPTAQSGELGRGIVAHRAIGADDPRGRVDERLKVGQSRGALSESWRLHPRKRACDGLRRTGRRDDRAEVGGARGASGALENRERRREVDETRERKPAFAPAKVEELGELVETPADRRLIPGRLCSEDRFPAGRRAGETGNQLEDDVEFEFAETDAVPR
jgi:hypothetical protein